MSYLSDKEKEALASSSISAKQKWYKKRKAVLEKVSKQAIGMTKVDDLLREILIVGLKILYELKKPK